MRRFTCSVHALVRLIVAVGCFASVAKGTAQAAITERAFWVWNRADSLTEPERTSLIAGGVHRIYWQTGELEIHGGELACRRTATLPAPDISASERGRGLEIIPVIRVSTSIRSPEQFSAEALGKLLRPIADAAPGREVQMDFDCPDRLLPLYAERLRTARRIADIRRLTITALAGWANVPASTALWSTVDAVFPMLYDTDADALPAPGASAPGQGERSPCRPRPLLDPDELRAELRAWSRCPIPWHAGLPAFARLTLYDPTGRPQGNLRSWDWEDLVFNPALALDRPAVNGTTVLRAVRPTRAGESPLPMGGALAWREPEFAALRAGVAEAEAAGAAGLVFFRLPDPPARTHPTGGGRSLTQLLTLFAPGGTPPAESARLSLRHADDGTDRWVLRNDSEGDLPPRFAGEVRGYGLELEVAGRTSGWRDAMPGDFHRVASHVFSVPPGANPTDIDQPVPVAIPLARRLTFWFTELPAHATLTTGVVQLAPGVDPAAVRFRLPALDHPEATPWQSLH